MNPDYRKQQMNPDGERGHKERSKIDKEIQRNNHVREYGVSERLSYTEIPNSFKDLEIEIRMNQCASKSELCYQYPLVGNCLTCSKYIVK